VKRHRVDGDWWPPHLAVFDPSEWPPQPGELAAHGAPRSARHELLVAHSRWLAARLAALPEGSAEQGRERLRGMREHVAMIRGNPPQRGER